MDQSSAYLILGGLCVCVIVANVVALKLFNSKLKKINEGIKR